MFKHLLIAIFVLTGLLVCNSGECQNKKKETIRLITKNDTIAYVIGSKIASNLKESIALDSLNLPDNPIMQGFIDVFIGHDSSVLNRAKKESIMRTFEKDQQKILKRKIANVTELNKKTGAAFMEENRIKEGIIQTSSGLQYKIIKMGNGRQPKINDEVTVNYEGKLIDGKIFDSSFGTNTPITFKISDVIPAWQEGLLLMNEGSVYELYAPSNLAYGDEGVQDQIPGGSTLIFKIELIKVGVASNPK